MSEVKTAADAPVSMFSDEVLKLNEVRQGIIKKINDATGGQMAASVNNATRVMLEHFDTGYLWLTQVEQFIIMTGAENVEAVAEQALANGNVQVVDGGKS